MPRFILLLQEKDALTRCGSLGGVTGAIVQAEAMVAFNLYTNAPGDTISSTSDNFLRAFRLFHCEI
jgi:hypothetical protein